MTLRACLLARDRNAFMTSSAELLRRRPARRRHDEATRSSEISARSADRSPHEAGTLLVKAHVNNECPSREFSPKVNPPIPRTGRARAGNWGIDCGAHHRIAFTKVKPPIPRTGRARAGNWGFEFGENSRLGHSVLRCALTRSVPASCGDLSAIPIT